MIQLNDHFVVCGAVGPRVIKLRGVSNIVH